MAAVKRSAAWRSASWRRARRAGGETSAHRRAAQLQRQFPWPRRPFFVDPRKRRPNLFCHRQEDRVLGRFNLGEEAKRPRQALAFLEEYRRLLQKVKVLDVGQRVVGQAGPGGTGHVS